MTVKEFLENRSPATYGKKVIILKNGKNCGSVMENLQAKVLSAKVATKWIFIEVK